MKIRVLAVDDDPIQLKLLVAFLKKLGFEGNTAVNGEEAVEKLKDGDYDVCLMDIQMPIIDGLEATKIIREELKNDLPIIAVTSMDDFSYERSVEAGMNDYIKKPVDIEALKKSIARHCPKARS